MCLYVVHVLTFYVSVLSNIICQYIYLFYKSQQQCSQLRGRCIFILISDALSFHFKSNGGRSKQTHCYANLLLYYCEGEHQTLVIKLLLSIIRKHRAALIDLHTYQQIEPKLRGAGQVRPGYSTWTMKDQHENYMKVF